MARDIAKDVLLPLALVVVVAVLLERADLLAPGIWLIAGVIVFGVLAIVVDYWRLQSDHFPQWFDDSPNVVVGIAGYEGGDLFRDAFVEGLHLSIKNRPRRGRKTRTAHDAWLHAIIEGGPANEKFEPQLVWAWGPIGGEITAGLVAGLRVPVALAMKAIRPSEKSGEATFLFQAGPTALGILEYHKTYLMDEQFHAPQGASPPSRRELRPGVYSVAIWVEYDGGRLSPRTHFRLTVDKTDAGKNRLEPVD